MTLIRIGHSAYKGANSYRLCFSKAQAIRVLCNRGVRRDIARFAIDKALINQGAMAYGENEAIEIVNEDRNFTKGYFIYSYSELRAIWSSKPEF